MLHRMVFALALFTLWWLIGAFGYWLIGVGYGVPGHEELSGGFTVSNCLYMAAITITTIGYTEATDYHTLVVDPGELVGKIYTIVYIMTSWAIVLYCSGNVVSGLIEGALREHWQKRKMDKILEQIEGHYVVCGCGSTGMHIVDELIKTGHQVVTIDRLSDDVFAEVVGTRDGMVYLSGDATEDDVLKRAGIERATGVFTALHDDKDNLFIALTAHQMNPNIRIVSRATERGTIGKLKVVGANAVISPNQIGGMRMASEMLRPSVVTFLDTMLRQSAANIRFSEALVSTGDAAAGKTLKEINTAGKIGLTVVGILSASGEIHYNPHGNTQVNAGDALIVICDKAQLDRLRDFIRSGH